MNIWNTMRTIGLGLALSLAACSTTKDRPVSAGSTDWLIGPIIEGKNYSVGMPEHPTPNGDGSYSFTMPATPAVHTHYVTLPHGSLAGKTSIRFRYRIEMEPGTVIQPRTAPGGPSMITLYFQQRGDDWSGSARYETYRWYYTPGTIMPLTAGEFEMVAPLDGNWTAIQMSSRETEPGRYAAAIADATEVGFVLGGGDGYGHGVYSEGGPVRFTIISYEVL